MRIFRDSGLDTTVLGTSSLLALAMGAGGSGPAGAGSHRPAAVGRNELIGRWHSIDGVVRLEIKSDGTYAGEVAGRKRSARGTYRVDGTTMTLRDDTGLRTSVTLYDDRLEMAGHRLGRA
jgi:hypothetical protein